MAKSGRSNATGRWIAPSRGGYSAQRSASTSGRVMQRTPPKNPASASRASDSTASRKSAS